MPWFERATSQFGIPKATGKRHEDGSNIYAVEERRVVGSVGKNLSCHRKGNRPAYFEIITTFASRCTNYIKYANIHSGQKGPYFT
jgi:hypothetical protein